MRKPPGVVNNGSSQIGPHRCYAIRVATTLSQSKSNIIRFLKAFFATVPCCHSHRQLIFGKNLVPQLKVYAKVLAGRHSQTLFYTGKHTGLSPADTRCEATPWIGGNKRPSIFQMLWIKLSKLKGIKSLFLFSDEICPSQ